MRDPLAWAIPLGRLFGITIRVHLLFPFVALGLVLRAAYSKPPVDGAWIDAAIVVGLLFLSVLLHEFGHCFGARWVHGDATEVLIWPLGGLASVDLPNTARAHFLTAAAGPLVNLVLCVACAALLYFVPAEAALQPAWNPLGYVGRGQDGQIALTTWQNTTTLVSPYSAAALLTHLFWCNWMLFLLNVVLIGFPLDGGRMFQAALWPYFGYRQSMLAAVFAGFITMFVVALFGVVMNEVMALCLAIFIYVSCKHQWVVLETGGEDSLFGYDFSQGYTSLERDGGGVAAEPKLSWFQRWKQERALKRSRREQEQRQAEERRMDQLLEKISAQGLGALTDEERRFMKNYSDRYKNRR